MKQKLREKLNELGLRNRPVPKMLSVLADTIPDPTIPLKMKYTIAVSQLVLFASQFRRNILIWNGSLIPINAISFCLSGSGSGKDSSVNAMRKNFKAGYDVIETAREQFATQRAIQQARDDNQVNPTEYNTYKKYLTSPMPLSASASTNEGFIHYLNKLEEDSLGSGYLYMGELAAEMSTSKDLQNNFKLLSELYDEGKKEAKIIKDETKQSKAIRNLPVSALFMSAPETILYDASNNRMFKQEFETKLARRSFFMYSFQDIAMPEADTIDEMIDAEIERNNTATEIINHCNLYSGTVAQQQLQLRGLPIKLSDEASRCVQYYKRYNDYAANDTSELYPISKLVRKHAYWKSLKLAGAIAIMKQHEEIELEDYLDAIVFTEMLDNDMEDFEEALSKQGYELFADMVNRLASDKPFIIDTHKLVKMKFIAGTSNLQSKMKELVSLAGSYDPTGVYTVGEKGITYSKLKPTKFVTVSFMPCSGTKEERKTKCSEGYKYLSNITFDKLADMLKKDYAYTPFKFENGKRSATNVSGAIKWVAIDIDKAIYTDEQMHTILQEFNHHIARTSDPDNALKYRVLLELDSDITLDDNSYKKFLLALQEYLGIEIDILPRSQIFFSYKDREVLSILKAKPLPTKELLTIMYELGDNSKSFNDLSDLNAKQRQALLADPTGTFGYAYNAKDGTGSVNLIKAAHHARKLGMDKEGILALMEDINEYWTYPMDRDRFEKTILNPIKNWSM